MLLTTKQALNAEYSKKYEDAILLYEKSLTNNKETDIEVYINLSVLYWIIATDVYFNDDNKIPIEIQLISGEKYNSVVDLGIKNYPESVELHFWKKYLDVRIKGLSFPEEECLQIINTYTLKSIIPYFLLSLFYKDKYKKEREQLLLQCKKYPTAKNIYIYSIIADSPLSFANK